MNNNRAYGSYDQFVFSGVEMFEKVVLIASVISSLSSNNTAKDGDSKLFAYLDEELRF